MEVRILSERLNRKSRAHLEATFNGGFFRWVIDAMALASRYFHGKRVSRSHYALLTEAERRGIIRFINQGRRTIAEQTRFWLNYLRYGHPLAARPWPGAPHIKYGREHHAIDANDGPVDDLAAFYRSQGIPVAFNVPGEPWHMDTLDEAALKRAAEKYLHTALPVLKRGQTGPSVVKLKKLLYNKGRRGFGPRNNPYFNKATEDAVKRVQKAHKMKADGIVGPNTWKILRG